MMKDRSTLVRELQDLVAQLTQEANDAQAKADALDMGAQKGFMYGVMFQAEQTRDQLIQILVAAMRDGLIDG